MANGIGSKKVDIGGLFDSLGIEHDYCNELITVDEQLECLKGLEDTIHYTRERLSNRVTRDNMLNRSSDSAVDIELAGLYADILDNVIGYIKQKDPEPTRFISSLVDTILSNDAGYRELVIEQLINRRVMAVQDPDAIQPREK